jgi:Trypsin-co-occurring domain 2
VALGHIRQLWAQGARARRRRASAVLDPRSARCRNRMASPWTKHDSVRLSALHGWAASRWLACSLVWVCRELVFGLSLGEGAGIACDQRVGGHLAGIVLGGWMSNRDVVSADGLGLADAIGLLRDELLKARAAGGDSDIQLPVESMTVQLQVAATRTRDGKAGFSVPIVNVELGGSAGWQREMMQVVTVVFSGPVDREGNPVKVAQRSSERKG